MKARINDPVNPLLVFGTALALSGALLALLEFGVLDWTMLCHYWLLLLVMVA